MKKALKTQDSDSWHKYVGLGNCRPLDTILWHKEFIFVIFNLRKDMGFDWFCSA